MPTQDLSDVYSALKQADAAGDTESAQKLADYIRSQPVQTEEPEQTPFQKRVSDSVEKLQHAHDLVARTLLEGAGQTAGTAATMPAVVENAIPYYAHEITNKLRGMVGLDPIINPNQNPLDTLRGPNSLAQKGEELGGQLATALGNDKPEGKVEERASSIGRAMVGGALTGGEAPIAGMISGGMSEGSRQVAEAAGAGPVGQTIASLAGGLAPTAAGSVARGVVRGTSGEQMQQAISDANENGTTLTAGQASGNKALQRTEQFSSNIPGGGALVNRTAAQPNEVQTKVNEFAGEPTTSRQAGSAAEAGIDTAKLGMKKEQDVAYTRLDNLMPQGKPVTVDNFDKALSNLTNNKYSSLDEPLIASIKKDFDAINEAGGVHTYQDLKDLRSRVGSKIDWGVAPNNPGANGDLKTLYTALGKDMQVNADNTSLAAGQAARYANDLYSRNSDRRELLNSIVGNKLASEDVFTTLFNSKGRGDTRLQGVMDTMNPEQQQAFRNAFVQKMGHNGNMPAPPGQEGSVQGFDMRKFYKNYKDMDEPTRTAVFGDKEASYRKNMETIMNTLNKIQSSPKMGTKALLGHGVGLGAVMLALIEHGTHLLTEPATALGTGAAITLSYGANKTFANAMANPKVVQALADPTKWGARSLPALVYQLNNMKDPDAKALADELKRQQNAH